ncbi:MAG: hypothetical protein KKF52_02815 [Nanoarchaeota archaeon]|nr:hypothetical protein [Nanoarchaeota archaeon]MBU4242142.1 hypothetical protein [Nanoarchaeota archaeon]MBU4352512.1 hypothetical protein [Nanoarchaeota archaeon]
MKEYSSPTISTYTFPNLSEKDKKDLENFELEPVKHLAYSLEKRILKLQSVGLKVKITDLNGNSLEMDSISKSNWKILGFIVHNKKEAEDYTDYIIHLSCQQDFSTDED